MTDIQEDVTISGNAIKGKLKYLDSGAIASQWDNGYFMALDLSANDFADLTSVKVGMSPSAGSGLVEIINDPDKNGVFKVSNKFNQKFVIVQSDGTNSRTQTYDLSQLELVKG
ncbi:MAG: hypothetical protein J6U54_20535 [Clostridiales bacterium]|nr:hypothetical protein [Clostridiales bacterium]